MPVVGCCRFVAVSVTLRFSYRTLPDCLITHIYPIYCSRCRCVVDRWWYVEHVPAHALLLLPIYVTGFRTVGLSYGLRLLRITPFEPCIVFMPLPFRWTLVDTFPTRSFCGWFVGCPTCRILTVTPRVTLRLPSHTVGPVVTPVVPTLPTPLLLVYLRLLQLVGLVCYLPPYPSLPSLPVAFCAIIYAPLFITGSLLIPSGAPPRRCYGQLHSPQVLVYLLRLWPHIAQTGTTYTLRPWLVCLRTYGRCLPFGHATLQARRCYRLLVCANRYYLLVSALYPNIWLPFPAFPTHTVAFPFHRTPVTQIPRTLPFPQCRPTHGLLPPHTPHYTLCQFTGYYPRYPYLHLPLPTQAVTPHPTLVQRPWFTWGSATLPWICCVDTRYAGTTCCASDGLFVTPFTPPAVVVPTRASPPCLGDSITPPCCQHLCLPVHY